MSSCTSCGSPIPDGQGSSCSMCYGDMSYGSDGYYEAWALMEIVVLIALNLKLAIVKMRLRSLPDKKPN